MLTIDGGPLLDAGVDARIHALIVEAELDRGLRVETLLGSVLHDLGGLCVDLLLVREVRFALRAGVLVRMRG